MIIKAIKAYGYCVHCNHQHIIEEIIEDTLDDTCKINWFNFSFGDKYYDNNGNEYSIQSIDHKLKLVIID